MVVIDGDGQSVGDDKDSSFEFGIHGPTLLPWAEDAVDAVDWTSEVVCADMKA
jgi:hypothetical protein